MNLLTELNPQRWSCHPQKGRYVSHELEKCPHCGKLGRVLPNGEWKHKKKIKVKFGAFYFSSRYCGGSNVGV